MKAVAWDIITNKPAFFSGSYNDLTDKPTIVAVVANPSDSASETLTKLKVGSTVYTVPQGGGGGGGSSDYTDLTNKPQINGVTLSGNVSGSTLGLQATSTLDTDVGTCGYTKNVGTLTGVTMNSSAVSPVNGVVDLGTVVTGVTVGGTSVVGANGVAVVPAIPDTSKCIEKVATGYIGNGSLQVTGLTALMAKYSHLIIYGYNQYADTTRFAITVDLSVINQGYGVNSLLARTGSWDRDIPVYIFRAGSEGSYYVDWNCGGSDQFYATVILGVPKDAE